MKIRNVTGFAVLAVIMMMGGAQTNTVSETTNAAETTLLASGTITNGGPGSATLTFVPVPDPAAFGLLGGALLVLGLIGRAKFARK